MYRYNRRPLGLEPGDRRVPPVGRSIVHNPKHPVRRGIWLLAHNLVHVLEGSYPGGKFATSEDPGPMHIPRRQVCPCPFSCVFMLHPHRFARFGREGVVPTMTSLDAGLLIGRADGPPQADDNPTDGRRPWWRSTSTAGPPAPAQPGWGEGRTKGRSSPERVRALPLPLPDCLGAKCALSPATGSSPAPPVAPTVAGRLLPSAARWVPSKAGSRTGSPSVPSGSSGETAARCF